jgi:hypothetical protein
VGGDARASWCVQGARHDHRGVGRSTLDFYLALGIELAMFLCRGRNQNPSLTLAGGGVQPTLRALRGLGRRYRYQRCDRRNSESDPHLDVTS